MKKRKLLKSVLILLIIGLGSCVTINIYFPAAAVEKAADRIVDEVWGDEGAKQEAPEEKGEPQSLLNQWFRVVSAVAGPDEAFAQEADINVTTPAIRALKEAIKNRAGTLKPYLDKGNVGISNRGLLAVRSQQGLNLKDKALIKRMIDAENRDRNSLYREIARANNFSDNKIPEIEKIFAGSWVSQAKPGWWIQDAKGNWSRKK